MSAGKECGEPAAALHAPRRLILASASPRRRVLLEQIGFAPDETIAPVIDEAPRPRELPRALAARLARAKAETVAASFPDAAVLGADTVVARGRRVLPKPQDAAQARACLRLLSGARHRVLGGIALLAPGRPPSMRLVTTVLAFKRLADDEVEHYVRSGEWQGKAGGYAIQGRAATFVRWLNGSYSNVVGLALFETAQMLAGIGFRQQAPGTAHDSP